MTALIGNQRDLFSIPGEVCYLNCAYMSPQLKAVEEAGLAAVRRKSSPWEIEVEDFFSDAQRLKALFGEIVAAPADNIALVPSVSYGIATAAANLRVGAGERILVLAEQFPSNVYSWQALAARSGAELLTIARPEDGDWTVPVLAALDESVAAIAVPQVHWTDGSLLDLAAVGERCRELGAALVLDLTQSLGARPFSLRDVEADFVVAAAYKWLLGPYSLGFLYVHSRHLEGRPLEEGWIARDNSRDFAALVHYSQRYQPGAERFDVGERSNFVLLPMAVKALEQVLGWGVGNIAASIARLTSHLAERAGTLGIELTAPGHHAAHLMGLRLAGLPVAEIQTALRAARIYASVRGDCLRVSPHLYNDVEDIDRLLAVLARFVPASQSR